MSKDFSIIGDIVNFLLVGIIFIGVLAIIFKVTLKKYNVKTSKIKFYGLFLGMDNKSILSFSLVTLNYIFLIWCTATFSGLNIYYVVITVAFMLLADIIINDYQRIPKDLVLCMINMSCIFVTSLLYNYLVNEYSSVFLLIILGLVTILVFLYFTYMTFKLLNNIVIREENLKKKNYKKL
jgi:hypothetical protein